MNALTYAANGWPVFPIEPRGKRPLTQHGVKDATTDITTIQEWQARWPDMNIGLATGHKFLVIDLDGPEGIQTWRDLQDRHGKAETATVRTGGGGWHLYYQAPARGNVNSARKLGAGVDTRGLGGYVVAPPSTHQSGRPYEWARKARLSPLPGWVSAILAPAAPVVSAHVEIGGDGQIVGLARAVAQAPVGQRNEVLNWAAYQAGRKAADPGEARANLLGAAVVAGLAEAEADRTFRSGYAAGLREAAPREMDMRPFRLEPARIRL